MALWTWPLLVSPKQQGLLRAPDAAGSDEGETVPRLTTAGTVCENRPAGEGEHTGPAGPRSVREADRRCVGAVGLRGGVVRRS